MKNRLHRFLRATAIATLVAYLPTSIDLSYAASGSIPLEVAVPSSFKLEQNLALGLPAELGRMDSFQPGSKGTILHIQTAHGHYEAQEKIEKLLGWLSEKFGDFPILLEGAADQLDPSRLEFFPGQPEANLQNARWLAKKSLVTGSELFLLQNKNAKGIGVESEAAYRKNHSQFARVLKAKKEAENFSESFKLQMEKKAAAFAPELRVFLKRLEQGALGIVALDVWLPELRRTALKYLSLDLNDAAWQVRWPMMVRFFKIQSISQEFKSEKFELEKKDFLIQIQKYLPASGSAPQGGGLYARVELLLNSLGKSVQLPEPETENAFTEMLRFLPADFDFEPYREVGKWIALLVLQSQLDFSALAEEMSRLENLIAEKLTRSEDEKKLLKIFADYRLLEKLLALQLTPSDFDKVNAEASAQIRPSMLAKRLSFSVPHLAELDVVFDEAVAFYQGAKLRDDAMIQRAQDYFKQHHPQFAVLVTGGFHSKPMREHFEKAGYAYGVVTPAITGLDEAGYQAYLKAMLTTAVSQPTASNQMIELALGSGPRLGEETQLRRTALTVARVRTGKALKGWRAARSNALPVMARVAIARSEARESVLTRDGVFELIESSDLRLRLRVSEFLFGSTRWGRVTTGTARFQIEQFQDERWVALSPKEENKQEIVVLAADGSQRAVVSLPLSVQRHELSSSFQVLIESQMPFRVYENENGKVRQHVISLSNIQENAANSSVNVAGNKFEISEILADAIEVVGGQANRSEKDPDAKPNDYDFAFRQLSDYRDQFNSASDLIRDIRQWEQSKDDVQKLMSQAVSQALGRSQRSEARGMGVFPWKAVLATASATLSASAFMANALSEVYYQTVIQPAQKMLEDEAERPEILDLLAPISWQFLALTVFVLLPRTLQKAVLYYGAWFIASWWLYGKGDWSAPAFGLVGVGIGVVLHIAHSELNRKEGDDSRSNRSEAREWKNPNSQKIVVIGTGFVGATKAVLAATDYGHDVVGVEASPEKREKLARGEPTFTAKYFPELLKEAVDSGKLNFISNSPEDLAAALLGREIVYLALPTPQSESGEADIRFLKDAVRQIANAVKPGERKILIGKSTAPPKMTVDALRAVVNEVLAQRRERDEIVQDTDIQFAWEPEFLREGAEVEDDRELSARIVIGAETPEVAARVKAVYENFNPNLNPPRKQLKIITTDLVSAPLVKYAANGWRGTKISFINYISWLTEELGFDIDEIANAIGEDSRVVRSFLNCGLGFGGSCFPKDLAAFVKMAKDLDVSPGIVLDALAVNQVQVDRFVSQMINELDGVSGKKIVILGGAFKPETSDTREARSIIVARELLAKGANVIVVDPDQGAIRELERELQGYGARLKFYTNLEKQSEVFSGASAIALVTEWKEFKSISFDQVRRLFERGVELPKVFDGRNALNGNQLRDLGFKYFDLGRGEENVELVDKRKFISAVTLLFLALRISYMNTLAEMAEKLGANIHDVKQGFGYDPVVSNAAKGGEIEYLNPGLGWGGYHLPRAVDFMADLSGQAELFATLNQFDAARNAILEKFGISKDALENTRVPFVDTAKAINQRQIQVAVEKMKRELGRPSLAGVKIAVAGLAHKQGENIDSSPSIALIQSLAAEGAEIHAWDPDEGVRTSVNHLLKKTSTAQQVHYFGDLHEAMRATEMQVIAYVSPEFLNKPEKLVRDAAGKVTASFIFDARHIFVNPAVFSQFGVSYAAVGMPTLRSEARADEIKRKSDRAMLLGLTGLWLELPIAAANKFYALVNPESDLFLDVLWGMLGLFLFSSLAVVRAFYLNYKIDSLPALSEEPERSGTSGISRHLFLMGGLAWMMSSGSSLAADRIHPRIFKLSESILNPLNLPKQLPDEIKAWSTLRDILAERLNELLTDKKGTLEEISADFSSKPEVIRAAYEDALHFIEETAPTDKTVELRELIRQSLSANRSELRLYDVASAREALTKIKDHRDVSSDIRGQASRHLGNLGVSGGRRGSAVPRYVGDFLRGVESQYPQVFRSESRHYTKEMILGLTAKGWEQHLLNIFLYSPYLGRPRSESALLLSQRKLRVAFQGVGEKIVKALNPFNRDAETKASKTNLQLVAEVVVPIVNDWIEEKKKSYPILTSVISEHGVQSDYIKGEVMNYFFRIRESGPRPAGSMAPHLASRSMAIGDGAYERSIGETGPHRSEARSSKLMPSVVFWTAVSAIAFMAAASPVVIGITAAWALLNLALMLRPYFLSFNNRVKENTFFQKYGHTNFGYEPEGALSHFEGGAEDYKGFFYEMTPAWVGLFVAFLSIPFLGAQGLLFAMVATMATVMIEFLFENLVSTLLRVFVYQTIENVSDIVRFYAHEPKIRSAANLVIRRFAERHILPEGGILAVLGNPTPEYPQQVVELIKKMNPQAILIVGNGGLDKDGKQIKKPEYENIREKVLEILAQENLADYWKDKIFVNEKDKSMNTGQNVGVVAEILARERAAFEARGISLKKIVLTQMPGGMLVSRRIFEYQWADNAKVNEVGDIQPQFISYAAAQPEIQEGVPMAKEAEDVLRLIMFGDKGDGEGQVWRLNEWHQGEKPFIRFHAEDHLPRETLEVVRQFLMRSEARLYDVASARAALTKIKDHMEVPSDIRGQASRHLGNLGVSGGRRGSAIPRYVGDFLRQTQSAYPQVFRSEAREMNPIEVFKDQLVLERENNSGIWLSKSFAGLVGIVVGGILFAAFGLGAWAVVGAGIGFIIGFFGIALVYGDVLDTKYFDNLEKILDDSANLDRINLLRAKQIEIETGAYQSIVPSPLNQVALDAIEFALARSEARIGILPEREFVAGEGMSRFRAHFLRKMANKILEADARKSAGRDAHPVVYQVQKWLQYAPLVLAGIGFFGILVIGKSFFMLGAPMLFLAAMTGFVLFLSAAYFIQGVTIGRFFSPFTKLELLLRDPFAILEVVKFQFGYLPESEIYPFLLETESGRDLIVRRHVIPSLEAMGIYDVRAVSLANPEQKKVVVNTKSGENIESHISQLKNILRWGGENQYIKEVREHQAFVRSVAAILPKRLTQFPTEERLNDALLKISDSLNQGGKRVSGIDLTARFAEVATQDVFPGYAYSGGGYSDGSDWSVDAYEGKVSNLVFYFPNYENVLSRIKNEDSFFFENRSEAREANFVWKVLGGKQIEPQTLETLFLNHWDERSPLQEAVIERQDPKDSSKTVSIRVEVPASLTVSPAVFLDSWFEQKNAGLSFHDSLKRGLIRQVMLSGYAPTQAKPHTNLAAATIARQIEDQLAVVEKEERLSDVKTAALQAAIRLFTLNYELLDSRRSQAMVESLPERIQKAFLKTYGVSEKLILSGKMGGTTIGWSLASRWGILSWRTEEPTHVDAQGRKLVGKPRAEIEALAGAANSLEDIVGRIIRPMAEYWNRSLEVSGEGYEFKDLIRGYVLSAPGWFDDQGRLTANQSNIAHMNRGYHFDYPENEFSISAQLLAKYGISLSGRTLHDGTAHAMGEMSLLYGTGARNFVYLGPGSGMAHRVMVDGEPFTGGEEIAYIQNELPNYMFLRDRTEGGLTTWNIDWDLGLAISSGTRLAPDVAIRTWENQTAGVAKVRRLKEALDAEGLSVPESETNFIGYVIKKYPAVYKKVNDQMLREMGHGIVTLIVQSKEKFGDRYPDYRASDFRAVLGGKITNEADLDAVKNGANEVAESFGLTSEDIDRMFVLSAIPDEVREFLAAISIFDQIVSARSEQRVAPSDAEVVVPSVLSYRQTLQAARLKLLNWLGGIVPQRWLSAVGVEDIARQVRALTGADAFAEEVPVERRGVLASFHGGKNYLAKSETAEFSSKIILDISFVEEFLEEKDALGLFALLQNSADLIVFDTTGNLSQRLKDKINNRRSRLSAQQKQAALDAVKTLRVVSANSETLYGEISALAKKPDTAVLLASADGLEKISGKLVMALRETLHAGDAQALIALIRILKQAAMLDSEAASDYLQMQIDGLRRQGRGWLAESIQTLISSLIANHELVAVSA